MGVRIHVYTKHEVEYGNGSFKWEAENLKRLLEDKGADVNITDDNIYGEWEIDEREFQEAVNRIKKMSRQSMSRYFDMDVYSLDEVKDTLMSFVEKGDHHDGTYYFCWF